ncbi:ABC transporter substrate-binding protein [Pseudonocardia sp. TRM90224]|uniref:ABC transporter substrate-binding protein n=1 Tax=Pseudonocardia sp. TRM90224 TaxID=2812678 RepID=UPI001E2D0B03|nr:ABC transporter substrate-binding protein [Pseudonocardia sp. TRM90224]
MPLRAVGPSRTSLGAVAAALAAALLVACSPVQSTAPNAGAPSTDSFGTPVDTAKAKPGGTLTIALSAEPDQLDPSLSRSLYTRYVMHTMCEKLYDVDQDTKIVPQLATALPQVSADGLTVTIPVRENVRFADGTPFDAAAVKTTFDRNLTTATSPRRSELGPITKVEATNPTTVVVTLSKPFAPLTAALADRAGMIMSPTALQALGEKFGTAPVCVGPFKFAKRVPANSIEVVKDPNYYAADKVLLDSITYRIITDAGIRAANLRSGDAQVADTLSTQDAPALRGEQGIQVLESNSLGYQALTINIGNVAGLGQPLGDKGTPIAKDPRVRKAFELALDREGLVRTVFGGIHSPACSPISPDSEFTSPAAQACTPHDPAAAKALLAEAGAPVPYPLTVTVTNAPDALRLMQALQATVAEGGFQLTLQPVEYSSLLDQQDRGEFEMLQLGWSGRIDPDANITNFVGTGGGQNVAGFSDPALDALLTSARTSTDQAERVRLYGEAVTKLQEADPIVYLYRQRNLTGVAASVSGVQVFPDGVIRVAFAGRTS